MIRFLLIVKILVVIALVVCELSAYGSLRSTECLSCYLCTLRIRTTTLITPFNTLMIPEKMWTIHAMLLLMACYY